MKWTIWQIRKANKEAGHHWFEEGALTFFDSNFEETVYEGVGGIYFISSEQFHDGRGYSAPRKWTVRQFMPETGEVETAGEFQAYDSAKEARKAARFFAKGMPHENAV